MNLDPELMKQLIEVFRTELDEKLQSMTNGLLALEKGLAEVDYEACLKVLFRDAHNIKGAARGVDIPDVARLAHSLETLFSNLQRDPALIDAALINLGLQSLDHMREAMVAFESHQPLSFDLEAFIQQLDGWGKDAQEPLAADRPLIDTTPSAVQESSVTLSLAVTEMSDVTRVTLDKLNRVSALVEDLFVSKMEIQDHAEVLHLLSKTIGARLQEWTEQRADVRCHDVLLNKVLHDLEGFSQTLGALDKKFRSTHLRVHHTAELLQDQARLMRLVPVATLLRPLARSVRDIAQALGRKVNYQVVGDDIEIDRPVLEGLKDPLIHLLRNAVDHGIESAEERSRKGKPESGCILITVSAVGNRINITVHDDGAGIHLADIAAVAIKRKLVSEAEVSLMSPDEIMALIFRPGFSSKAIITDVSGRGVGLDVVMSRVTSMRGAVSVNSEEGLGTTFTLSFPLTLSTDRGLMVRAGGELFALPTSSVVRVMEIQPSALSIVQSGHVITIEGKAVAAFQLSHLLALDAPKLDLKQALSAVVITKNWKTIVLLVEEIIGEREMVIKRLQPPLISVRNVAGGTLMGNGKVIVVLNPSDLVSGALHHPSLIHFDDTTKEKGPAQKRRVLVVDDSITTRSLEKNILESQGYEVVVAVNGEEGWILLNQSHFDIVVTDVEMPQLNGFELTDRIKKSQSHAHIPVIMVTSLATDHDRRRGIEVGADAYIVKGQFETLALLDVVNQLI